MGKPQSRSKIIHVLLIEKNFITQSNRLDRQPSCATVRAILHFKKCCVFLVFFLSCFQGMTQLSTHKVYLLLHKIRLCFSTNLISNNFNDFAAILAIVVTKSCSLDLPVVKAQSSIAGSVFFLPFSHSRKIFKDHFVTDVSTLGFSINFLSFSAFFPGSRKDPEQDAMSPSVSVVRRSIV